MTSAHLIPCLTELRSEFNELNPSRDKSSDGWIGDTAHQSRTSDHNPDSQGRVLAIDIDSTGPWPVPFDQIVVRLVQRCRSGEESRLEYIIWDRSIWSHSTGFKEESYGGSDPHTSHVHFSARHDHHGESDVSDWFLNLRPYTTYQPLNGLTLPVLHHGDTDAEHTGYKAVWRAQKALGVKADGWYGDKTAEAVKHLGFGDGKTIHIGVWTNLFGLSTRKATQ